MSTLPPDEDEVIDVTLGGTVEEPEPRESDWVMPPLPVLENKPRSNLEICQMLITYARAAVALNRPSASTAEMIKAHKLQQARIQTLEQSLAAAQMAVDATKKDK